MAQQLNIHVTSPMDRRMVRPIFHLTDWLWPILVIASIPVVVSLDSTVSSSAGGFQGSVGYVGAIYPLAVAVIAGMRWFWRRRAHRHLLNQTARHEQYLAIDDTGVRYGWEGLAHYAIAWKAVASVEWSGDTLTLLLGRHRLNVSLGEFRPDQKDALRAFLAAMRDGVRPQAAEPAPSLNLPPGGPMRIILKG